MMQMKKIISMVMVLVVFKALSQQDAQYSLYMYNALNVNPAYAGSTAGTTASLLYRYQWLGIEGAPKTLAANLNMRYGKERLGTGISVINDRIGLFNRNQVQIAQSYQLRMEKWILSFGLQAYLDQSSGAFSNANFSSMGIQDAMFSSNITTTRINFGTGVYAYNNNFWFGYSMPHILKQQLTKETVNNFSSTQSIHQYVTAGYLWNINDTWQLKPSALVKMHQNTGVQTEMGAIAYYNKFLGAGVSYRNKDSFIGIVEFQMGNYARLLYAYDRTTSALGCFTTGSHEIMLKFFLSNSYRGQVSPRLF
jgi:type IX secretion system PorP/SprF family membrane protein